MSLDAIKKLLSPEQIVEHFKQALGESLLDSSIHQRSEGVRETRTNQVWLTLDRKSLVPAVEALIELHYPHLSVISGCDLGDEIELTYHFYVYYGESNREHGVNFKVLLPKSDLTVDTLTGLIPGALTSEREKQEFFGITVNDIPDSRRIFLPDDFPEGLYPWRKDETGIQEDMVKKLYDVGKEEGEKRRQATAPPASDSEPPKTSEGETS